MKKFLFALGLVSVFLLPFASRADTVNIFSISGTLPDGYYSGRIQIDVTTGQPGYGSFDMVLIPGVAGYPNETYDVYGFFGPAECGCDPVPTDKGFTLISNGNVLFLETDDPLVGFTGGHLCGYNYGGLSNVCSGDGEGPVFYAPGSPFFPGEFEYIGPDELVLLSSVQTPEPSSLILFGTGILGAFGAIRRRFIAA